MRKVKVEGEKRSKEERDTGVRVLAFQKDACNCNESFQTGGREGGRAAGEGWGRVVRKNRGARCKEMWENDGETRAAYWDARRRGSTAECVSLQMVMSL